MGHHVQVSRTTGSSSVVSLTTAFASESVVEKIQRLALEISELMNETAEGEFSLSIAPSNHPTRAPFRFYDMVRSKQQREEILRDIRELIGPEDAHERLTYLAGEYKRIAEFVYPDVTDWTMWQGEGESGNPGVFFYLTGNRKAGG